MTKYIAAYRRHGETASGGVIFNPLGVEDGQNIFEIMPAFRLAEFVICGSEYGYDTVEAAEDAVEKALAQQVKDIAAAQRSRGRPRMDPAAPTVRTTVRLTQAQLAKAMELGDGGISAGVRLALEGNAEAMNLIEKLWRDNARLEAQVEELKAQLANLINAEQRRAQNLTFVLG